MSVKFLGQKEMPLSELRRHPDNPRRGDVNAIAESLEQFGQYRSIVALQDGTILAGHHVFQAAKNLKLGTIRVDVVDTDPQTATKIMLADNRLADLGVGNDLDLLFKDLDNLDDLLGTGFDEQYLKDLEAAINGPPDADDDLDDPDTKDTSGYKKLSLVVEGQLAAQWEAHRKMFPDDSAAFGYLFG